MAGLMAAAIVSDTVMFKSPTSTPRDFDMATRMARLANVSLDELGKAIFSATCPEDKSAADLLMIDFKDFHIADHHLGVGQITCVDSVKMLERKEEFLQAMRDLMERNSYDMVLLMLTDVLLEGTQLIYIGDRDTLAQAFGAEPDQDTVFLPKVMSRKKQIIPMLSALWG